MRPNNLKKCMKFNWNFQRGGKVLEKKYFPSLGGGGVWIFSGTTHSEARLLQKGGCPNH